MVARTREFDDSNRKRPTVAGKWLRRPGNLCSDEATKYPAQITGRESGLHGLSGQSEETMMRAP